MTCTRTSGRTRVTAGESVDFSVTITNDNNKGISGSYSLQISVPQPNGGYEWTSPYTGYVTVPAGGTVTVPVTAITYGAPGTSEYHGTFDFGVSSKGDQGYITVTSSGSSGSLRIGSVTYKPSVPRDGSLVNFTVKVKSSYSLSRSVGLELYVDGKEVYLVNGSIGANSEKSFTLHWLAQAGEHSYTVKLYSVSNGRKSEEDERGGKVMVASPGQQFAVSLEAFPRELDGGGRVWFTVKGWNYAHDALNVQFHVVNESGKVVYPKDGDWISKYLPEGASNYTLASFDRDVYGVGNHTYTLVARISGEKENDSATITIKPVNGAKLKQVGTECSNLYFTWEFIDYHGTLTCRAMLYNPANKTIVITNSSIGEPAIGILGVRMTPASLGEHFSIISKNISNTRISPQGNTIITFKSEVSGVPLLVLEYYWGTYYTITISYDIHLNNGSTPTFALRSSGQITQNNYEVTADIGLNIFLFKGVPAELSTMKVAIQAGEYAKVSSGLRTLIGMMKEFVGWYKWFHP